MSTLVSVLNAVDIRCRIKTLEAQGHGAVRPWAEGNVRLQLYQTGQKLTIYIYISHFSSTQDPSWIKAPRPMPKSTPVDIHNLSNFEPVLLYFRSFESNKLGQPAAATS